MAGERWRLGHRPALDGLRGVAVLLVLASHLTTASGALHSAGAVGVTVFFTLSGFLITSLLLSERERTGRVSLTGFYRRRALRLAPAMVAVVLVVAALGVAFGSSYVGWPLVAGSLTYSANWVAMAGGGSGSALGHTWSLAIEEQFYLIWPFAFLLLNRAGRRTMIAVLAGGAVASALLRFVLWSDGWQRVYYGFDTRADALLVGCLLAVLMHGRRVTASRPAIAAAAVVAIAATSLGGLVFVFTTMPLVVALLTAVVIFCSVQAGDVVWLSWRPLVWTGQRSYGLYLWHYPVVLAAAQLVPGAGVLVTAVLVLPVAFGVTVLSWRYVETPFLRLKRRQVEPDRPVGIRAFV